MESISPSRKVIHINRKKFLISFSALFLSFGLVLFYFYITRTGGNYSYFQRLLQKAMTGDEYSYDQVIAPMGIFLLGELLYFTLLFLRQNDLTGKVSWGIIGLFIGTIIAQGFWYDLRTPILVLNGVTLLICLASKGHLSEGAKPLPIASFFGGKKNE